VWEGRSIQRYVVPAQNIFLSKDTEPTQELITDRVLFAGNLNSSQVMSAYGDDPVVREVTDYVTNVKCKEWGTAAWHAYEEIASQKVAAGVCELHPDHSFFWSLGRELITNVVTTAFRTTVFESINFTAGSPILNSWQTRAVPAFSVRWAVSLSKVLAGFINDTSFRSTSRIRPSFTEAMRKC